MEPDSGKLFFRAALTDQGWCENVTLTLRGGVIEAVACDADPPADAVRHEAAALPGLCNLHSHAFQRAMAGLAEGRRGGDGFWSWREVMYRLAAALTPEDVETIAALAYMEMLEAGFTAVAEFHYLHHQPDGAPYGDPAELGCRIVSAAATAGISLTLLPVFYAYGGFGRAPTAPAQRRFVTNLDQFARLAEAAGAALKSVPGAKLGIAAHSLRAVGPEQLPALVALAGASPFHIHVAEQVAEVEACVSALGARPVEWLLDHAPVNDRWCLVHATHVTAPELERLARSGAVAGLCPVTEANLGDGIFPLVDYLSEDGALGIGTDSNVCISAADEIRTLEYGQRLRDRARNRAASAAQSTGRRLFEVSARRGSAALGGAAGSLRPGMPADIVALDLAHPPLIGRCGDTLLDSWIFGAADRGISDAWVGGRRVVAQGRHFRRDSILAAWARCARRLRDAC